jgi:hypothetical protein
LTPNIGAICHWSEPNGDCPPVGVTSRRLPRRRKFGATSGPSTISSTKKSDAPNFQPPPELAGPLASV